MYKVIYPTSDLLKKHIVSYTVIDPKQMTDEIAYFAFPQLGATIAFLNHASISHEKDRVEINSKRDIFSGLFLGKYISPLEFHYKNFVPEIAINFNATGIQYFYKDYFSKYASGSIQLTTSEELLPDRKKLFEDDTMATISYLEEFLESRYQQLDLTAIEKAVELIQEDSTLKTKEIAEKVFLTEKTLKRNFRKYIGCTTSQYKQICKFRNAIQDNFENSKSKNLTQIGLDNQYYDSPHFYKEINKISSFKPKEFFSKVASVGKDSFPYIFS